MGLDDASRTILPSPVSAPNRYLNNHSGSFLSMSTLERLAVATGTQLRVDSYIDSCNRQYQKIIQDGGLVSFTSPDQPNPALDKAVLAVLGQIMDGTIDDASDAANRLMGLFEIARGL